MVRRTIVGRQLRWAKANQATIGCPLWLSEALRVPHNVAEAVLAHRPPGIVGTYNLHEYEDEKADALEKWAQRLNSIVSPPAKVPDKKIVPLRKRRR